MIKFSSEAVTDEFQNGLGFSVKGKAFGPPLWTHLLPNPVSPPEAGAVDSSIFFFSIGLKP